MKYLSTLSKRWVLVVLLATLLLVVLSEVTPCKAETGADKKKVCALAQNYLQVGIELYKQGNYQQAEKYLLFALDYKDYLTEGEQKLANEYLEKAHAASNVAGNIVEDIGKADDLIKQGKLLDAQTLLQKVAKDETLPLDKKEVVTELLKKVEVQLQEQKKEIAKVYDESVSLYNSGNLEKAREGFVKVVQNGLLIGLTNKTAEDYLVKIDKALKKSTTVAVEAEKESETNIQVVAQEVTTVPAPQTLQVPEKIEQQELSNASASEQKPAEGGYIEKVNRRINIIRGHVKAVVKDATDKARTHIEKGEFEKAQGKVDTAKKVINENQRELGEDLYKYYNEDLNKLSEEIAKGLAVKTDYQNEQKNQAAINEQEAFRSKMENDRKNRVTELLQNALNYQKQQRYEEALGQIESLLLIDPLNNQALIQKDMLEDMIEFRKQIELQKRIDTQRVEILKKTDEATTPYSDEVTYPKNWLEIKEKRVPVEEAGDLINASVYKQLEEAIVDLPNLRPDMPFSEAIETLQNSVKPQLKIIVMWSDLEKNAQIDKTTPINMDPIFQVTLGTALNLILGSVSRDFVKLGYTVKDGVVGIATKDSLEEVLVTKVYDVSFLLGEPANFYGKSAGRSSGGSGGGGGMSGGSGGDMGGGMDIMEAFGDADQDTTDRRKDMQEGKKTRKESLIKLIKDTIEPESWFDAGGLGTITDYEDKKLIIMQSRSIHKRIKDLIDSLRKSLGEQISIEARFLIVGENFLRDIGLDLDFRINAGGKFGLIDVSQGSSDLVIQDKSSEITGSWAGAGEAMNLSGTYGGLLDDLQVSFVLRATEAHRDSRTLTAPKVTVLSGESASFQQNRLLQYALPANTSQYDRDYSTSGSTTTARRINIRSLRLGTLLNVTPTISPDKKYILLTISCSQTTLVGFDTYVQQEVVGTEVVNVATKLPQQEISKVETRVSVPDGGTLLLGGQKVAAETNLEAGVPVLNKVPLLGRAFSNRSNIKDEKILLILVKPTIILQDETEAEAVTSLENHKGF